MIMLRPSASREDGFTVLELVWSAAILLVVAIGVIGALNFAAESTRRSAARVTALNVATEQLEKARSMPYDSVGVVYLDGSHGSPAGTLPATTTVDGAYQVTTSVTWARDPSTNRALYKKVRVDVAWESGTVNVSTNIFGKSNLVNTGDMSVHILYLDGNGPVANTLVTITPTSGTAVSVRTDETGEAFFGFVPSGTYAVTAAVSGYIVDVSALTAVTVTADTLASVTAYAQLASSMRVTTVVTASDGTTTPLSGVSVTAKKTGFATLSGTTGTDGSVVFTELVSGDYSISATLTGYGPASGTVTVVTPGLEHQLQLSMSTRVGLTVLVVDGANAIISGASVTVVGPLTSTTIVGSGLTPVNNGEITFTGLANGTYTVTATKGTLTATKNVIYDGTQGVTTLVLVAPTSSTGSVKFEARYKSGNAIFPNATLKVKKKKSDGSYTDYTTVKTDAYGYAYLSGVAPGDYRVSVDMDNWQGDPDKVYFTVTVGGETQVLVYIKSH